MNMHTVKIWPENFDEIDLNDRTSELRKNDRDYSAGDTINLEEWNPQTEQLTGRHTIKKIKHVLKISDINPKIKELLGLNPGFGGLSSLVVLSLEPVD